MISNTQDQIEILSLVVSQSEQYLGLFAGKNCIKEEEEIYQAFIYKIEHGDVNNRKHSPSGSNRFTLVAQIDLPPKYRKFSKTFSFFEEQIDQFILMIDQKGIYKYNYRDETDAMIYAFSEPLEDQPDYVVFDQSQKFAMVASASQAIWIDLAAKKAELLDSQFSMTDFKCLMTYGDKFYLLANKLDEKLGYYLLEINTNYAADKDYVFVIKWVNKLNIGNADLDVVRHVKVDDDNNETVRSEIIISFKTIYENTYTVLVLDLSSYRILYKHNIYQLWESPVKGFLSTFAKDFIVLNKDGMSFIRLDDKRHRRQIDGQHGIQPMVHSLHAAAYLKVEDTNMIQFEESTSRVEKCLVMIQQQHLDNNGNTYYDEIFRLSMEEMDLVEIILVQSIFLLDSSNEILELIDLQPNRTLFFKSFMELDLANLIQILSFESRVVRKLLVNLNAKEDEHDPTYPLFYKMQQNLNGKVHVLTPIKIALENNQIRALNSIIGYIVEHQNHYAFSFLFQDTLISLLQKGIKVTQLLQSDIFEHTFELESWPAIHTDPESRMKPYSGSVFQLKDQYNNVFHDVPDVAPSSSLNSSMRKRKEDSGENIKQKFYKIKYTLNTLPMCTYEDGKCKNLDGLMDALAETDELSLFEAKVVNDYYDFMWNMYAKHIHYFGACVHFIYLILFVTYVNQIYLNRNFGVRVPLVWCMVLCLIYPAYYDLKQLTKVGLLEYFQDPWNFVDQGHIWIGLASLFVQRFVPDILNEGSQILMIVTTLIMLVKTFFYLRIFKSLSFLVSMLSQVFLDLRPFFFFYSILIILFGVILAILDYGNYEFSDNEVTRGIQQTATGPDREYLMVDKLVAKFIVVLRVSIGDFGFDTSTYLNELQNQLYWVTFLLMCTICCIIYMNFIIAEVSATYQKVKDTIKFSLLQERGALINESEDLVRAIFGEERVQGWTHLFPKYIITRELDQ